MKDSRVYISVDHTVVVTKSKRLLIVDASKFELVLVQLLFCF